MSTKDKYAVIGLSVFTLGIVLYSVMSFLNTTIPTSLGRTSFSPILTGTTDSGDVAIELTPDGITDGKLTLNIAVNTHSVELTQFNLQEITTLEYDGQKVKPSSIPTLSGHHSTGTMQFTVDKEISSFTITITGIPKVEERIYRW